jgi:hypothetical protein
LERRNLTRIIHEFYRNLFIFTGKIQETGKTSCVPKEALNTAYTLKLHLFRPPLERRNLTRIIHEFYRNLFIFTGKIQETGKTSCVPKEALNTKNHTDFKLQTGIVIYYHKPYLLIVLSLYIIGHFSYAYINSIFA